MSQGRIQISKLNLMGYTPETQAYVVQNAGGMNGASVRTFHFLNSIRKHLDVTSFGLVIHAPRLAKFKAYCESKGFEVAEAAQAA